MSYFDQTGLPFAEYLQSGSPEAEATLAAIAAGVGFSQRIVGETPVGAIDGTNSQFETSHDFIPESVAVYLGIRLMPVTDFLTIGNRIIHLSVAPNAGEEILVDYLKVGA